MLSTAVAMESIQESINQPGVRFPPSPPGSKRSSESGSSSGAAARSFLSSSIPLPPTTEKPKEVLGIDKDTPDNHVPRDPRLVRLTGVHPFNVESPLKTLFDHGFLTPPELFYVRNHGAVPKVVDEKIPDWTVSIEGLVEHPMTLSFRQILEEFEQVTLPVTLVCAGNRRKEQNMVRKSQGFSWGAAGLSTALFTGPLLAEILQFVKPKRKARYVCMEGADKLPNGYYGTSIKLAWVMDPERGIMLAHHMNGSPLPPDHGRPLRAVVPGQIGGRSVKWLKRLIITDEPSKNWYHIYDNRVLPTVVTPQMAKENKSWWTDERYAIYDLSVNSAIAYPAHGETLPLSSSGMAAGEKYSVRGYAYTGGMRRITRVELSLDKGRTWELAGIEYPEDKYRAIEDVELFGGRLDMAGKEACYCWCFWDIEIAVERLANAEDMVVRAMDDSMTIQPRDMYWSVLGMMQNSWFRIAIRRDEPGKLRFEHPTLPALQAGGWMDRVKKERGDFGDGNWGERKNGGDTALAVAAEPQDAIKMVNDKVDRVIGIEELKLHEGAGNPWFVVNGEVYDGAPFLKDHPGGAQSIVSAAGQDVADEFMGIHSENAKSMMPDYHIGTLSAAARAALASRGPAEESESNSPTFLSPRIWKASTLIAKKAVSHDTRIFTFALEHGSQSLGLPVGQHLMLRVKSISTGETIVRSYTPISEDTSSGTVDLLVKIYFGTNTSPGGKMTTAIDVLPIGHSVSFKGPIGKLQYLSRGEVLISELSRHISSLVMICAGSGITPIFQVLRAVMRDVLDPTKCIVLDGNRLEEDILCHAELDGYAKANPDRLQLIHTLSKPSDAWKGRKGRISKDLVDEAVGKVRQDEALVLVCGPEMLEKSVRRWLDEAGWKEENTVFF